MKSAGTNGTFNKIKDKERMFAVKKLFASIVVVLCITTFAGLSSAKNHPYGVDTMPTLSTSGSEYSEYIGVDAAKAIALRNVGLTESDVVFVKAKLDRDDGKMMYDIKFYSGNAEYDYEIDAHTGNIIKLNYDIEGYEISNVPVYRIRYCQIYSSFPSRLDIGRCKVYDGEVRLRQWTCGVRGGIPEP